MAGLGTRATTRAARGSRARVGGWYSRVAAVVLVVGLASAGLAFSPWAPSASATPDVGGVQLDAGGCSGLGGTWSVQSGCELPVPDGRGDSGRCVVSMNGVEGTVLGSGYFGVGWMCQHDPAVLKALPTSGSVQMRCQRSDGSQVTVSGTNASGAARAAGKSSGAFRLEAAVTASCGAGWRFVGFTMVGGGQASVVGVSQWESASNPTAVGTLYPLDHYAGGSAGDSIRSSQSMSCVSGPKTLLVPPATYFDCSGASSWYGPVKFRSMKHQGSCCTTLPNLYVYRVNTGPDPVVVPSAVNTCIVFSHPDGRIDTFNALAGGTIPGGQVNGALIEASGAFAIHRTYVIRTWDGRSVSCPYGVDRGAPIDWLDDPADTFGEDPFDSKAEDPVDLASGNFTTAVVDIDMPASTFGLDFVRTYNSLDDRTSPLGGGWTHSYVSTLLVTASGSVVVRGGDGRRVEFTPDGAGGWERAAGVHAFLVKNANGSYSLRHDDGHTDEFDAAGQLTGRTNWDGQAITVTRSNGQIASVTSSTGRSLTFAYTSGRLTTVTADDGRAVSYAYGGLRPTITSVTAVDGSVTSYELDDRGWLAGVVDPDGVRLVDNVYDEGGRVVEQTTPDGRTVAFTYDGATGEASITDTHSGAAMQYASDGDGRNIGITDPHGYSRTMGYDAAGNPTTLSNRLGDTFTQTFDAHGNVTTRTGPDTVEESFTYDALDRVLTTTNGEGETSTYTYDGNERIPSTITDPPGATTSYDVNANGLALSLTDPDGVTLSFSYDAERNLTSITDEAGATTTLGYDAAGNLITIQSPEGRVTTRSYDAAGRVLTVQDPTGATITTAYTPAGRVASETDATAETTTYTYNTAGRLATISDPLGNVTSHTYDDDGNLVSTERPGGATTSKTYDPLGRVLTETDATGVTLTHGYDADGKLTSATDGNSGVVAHAYDQRGRRASTTDQLGRVTSYTYDDAGRVATFTDPAAIVTSYVYDAAGRLTSMTRAGSTWATGYTLAGRKASETDPNGHTTTYGYDLVGRLATVTDPLGKTTTYTHDDDGLVTSETTPTGLVTSYTYDPAGRIATVTSPTGAGTTYTYTPRGEIATVDEPATDPREFVYDPAGRLERAGAANGADTLFAYDGRGNLTQRTDANLNVETYTYDLADRLLTRTDPLAHTTTHTYDNLGRLQATTDSTGRSVTHTYDAANQITRRAYGDGSITDYTYDALGRRTSMLDATGTTVWTWDDHGNPTSVTSRNRTISYAYDPAGNRTTITYPDGLTATTTYDAANRATTITHPHAGTLAYTYDDDGRLLTETLPDAVTRAYGYTNGQLTTYQETTSGTPNLTTLTYDPAGRVATATTGSAVRGYTYDQAGQLTQAATAGRVTTYTYDQVGNRAAVTEADSATSPPDTTYQYTYNNAHQLTSVAEINTLGLTVALVTFANDTAGRQTSITGLGRTRTLTYDARGLLTQLQTTTTAATTDTHTRLVDSDGVVLNTTYTPAVGNPDTTDITWDRGLPIPQIAITADATDTNYLYGPSGRAAALRGGQADTFSRDAHGSTLAAGTAADLARSPSYDEYGQPEPSSPHLATLADDGYASNDATIRFAYRGEAQIDGFLHLRARDYHPATGRFPTPDPLPGVPTEVTVANPYPYANNDPVNMVDPLGLRASDDDLTIDDLFVAPLPPTTSPPVPVPPIPPVPPVVAVGGAAAVGIAVGTAVCQAGVCDALSELLVPDSDFDRTVIFRELDEKSPGRAATNPGQFRYDADGVSFFEQAALPKIKPFKLAAVILRGSSAGHNAIFEDPILNSCVAVNTPDDRNTGLHWSVRCEGGSAETKTLLSTYARAHPEMISPSL